MIQAAPIGIIRLCRWVLSLCGAGLTFQQPGLSRRVSYQRKDGYRLIEFRNVSKVYNNGTEALHNINLTVEKGEFVFIVGSSGAGKSTFLKLVMCEERPNSGQIIVDGVDVSRLPKRKIPYIRRKMALCSRISA